MESKRCLLPQYGSIGVVANRVAPQICFQFGQWSKDAITKTGCVEPSRQETRKLAFWSRGGLEFSPIFTYNSFEHNRTYVQK